MHTNPKNPLLTVDAIIELPDGKIVLIERRNPPHGWALPGGFVDYGETLEDAAHREALEETGLHIKIKCQMHAYSAPDRDQRFHTASVVFIASADGVLEAGDDAQNAESFALDALPSPIVFNHARIIADYINWKKLGFKVFENK